MRRRTRKRVKRKLENLKNSKREGVSHCKDPLKSLNRMNLILLGLEQIASYRLTHLMRKPFQQKTQPNGTNEYTLTSRVKQERKR